MESRIDNFQRNLFPLGKISEIYQLHVGTLSATMACKETSYVGNLSCKIAIFVQGMWVPKVLSPS